MKKITKRILALCMAVCMLFVAIPVQASGEKEVFISKKLVYEKTPYMYDVYPLAQIKGAKKISVKCSDKSVLTITKRKDKMEKGKILLMPKVKKPGRAVVTVTVDGKKYKCKVLVKKYVQGIRSLKIGNITIPESKLNKSNRIYIKYSQVANKNIKMTAKLKDGWELASVENKTNTFGPIRFDEPIKFTGGPGGYFQFCVYNGRLGREPIIRVYLTK